MAHSGERLHLFIPLSFPISWQQAPFTAEDTRRLAGGSHSLADTGSPVRPFVSLAALGGARGELEQGPQHWEMQAPALRGPGTLWSPRAGQLLPARGIAPPPGA